MRKKKVSYDKKICMRIQICMGNIYLFLLMFFETIIGIA